MKILSYVVGSAALALALMVYGGDVHADSKVQMELEEVVLVEWRELEDATRYEFHHGDVKLGRSLGGARYFSSDVEVDWDEVRVKATTLHGDPVGKTEVVATSSDQRLVVRWDEGEFDTPFLGVHSETETGGVSRMVQELQEQPHVIPSEVDEVRRVLFGEAVDRPDRRLPFAPFSFENGEVESFGPYVDLELP